MVSVHENFPTFVHMLQCKMSSPAKNFVLHDHRLQCNIVESG